MCSCFKRYAAFSAKKKRHYCSQKSSTDVTRKISLLKKTVLFNQVPQFDSIHRVPSLDTAEQDITSKLRDSGLRNLGRKNFMQSQTASEYTVHAEANPGVAMSFHLTPIRVNRENAS